MSLTPVERVEHMLKMEPEASEKDAAGIFIANKVDSAVKRKLLQQLLDSLRRDDERPQRVL